MQSIPVIAVLDIGKTNKKILVFDGDYNVISEESVHLQQTVDEDGDPCEDIHLLTKWVKDAFSRLVASKQWEVKAVNVSAYGASLVHLGKDGLPAAPLYNYLKPLPEPIHKSFVAAYPGVFTSTASPDLGSLNSGMVLYMLKKAKHGLFKRVTCSLHLPQYAAFLLNGLQYSDLTSLGCHTVLWDFQTLDYHQWVAAEELTSLMAPIKPTTTVAEIRYEGKIIYSGIGLHDSSAALIPYLLTNTEPFCLISTGTWSISLNPFNHEPLTTSELTQDCLCYLTYDGVPVKASRLFSGHFHDLQVAEISKHFAVDEDFFKMISPDRAGPHIGKSALRNIQVPFEVFDPSRFSNAESVYVYLVEELVARQVQATNLVLGGGVKKIYVDGGFSMNSLFMTLLSKALPGYEIYAASVAQASALGAALAIHESWNKNPVKPGLLALKRY